MRNVFGVPEAAARAASRSVSLSTAMTADPETCPWIVAVPAVAPVPPLSPTVPPPPPPHAVSVKAMNAIKSTPLIVRIPFISSSLKKRFMVYPAFRVSRSVAPRGTSESVSDSQKTGVRPAGSEVPAPVGVCISRRGKDRLRPIDPRRDPDGVAVHSLPDHLGPEGGRKHGMLSSETTRSPLERRRGPHGAEGVSPGKLVSDLRVEGARPVPAEKGPQRMFRKGEGAGICTAVRVGVILPRVKIG